MRINFQEQGDCYLIKSVISAEDKSDTLILCLAAKFTIVCLYVNSTNAHETSAGTITKAP
ncbi:hypothetical protein CXF79_00180 [Colwellia sp. Bg11-28]|nr:hypothetical protein CXF79_00180 [Colwellia sp. Bg11-28]